jgi:hypothetical protein
MQGEGKLTQRMEEGRVEKDGKRNGVVLSSKCRCIDVSPGYIYIYIYTVVLLEMARAFMSWAHK